MKEKISTERLVSSIENPKTPKPHQYEMMHESIVQTRSGSLCLIVRLIAWLTWALYLAIISRLVMAFALDCRSLSTEERK